MIKFEVISNTTERVIKWEYEKFEQMKWAINNIVDVPSWEDVVISINNKSIKSYISFENFYDLLQIIKVEEVER